MNKRNRRQFIEESMAAAAAAVASAGSASELFAAQQRQTSSPNEKLGVAVVGARGRGGSHIGVLASRKDTEILYICDVDRDVGMRRVREAGKRQQGREPRFEEDIRRVLDDKSVDVVSIATPHHWHALGAIWSIQAGKDVFLEKPVSHNVSEGRRIVEAARKYKRICQTGTQCRSNPGVIDAIRYVRSGQLGRVTAARSVCHKQRRSIGPGGVYNTPPSVNYHLWLGPAPLAPLTRPQLHYDWHWQWPYGSGELGGEGIHQIDIARWGLGRDKLCDRVISCGARSGGDDASETASEQLVVCDYGDAWLTFEVRCWETSVFKGARVRVVFEGTEGFLVIAGRRGGAAFDRSGNKVKEFSGRGGNDWHIGNFLQAVRSRRLQELNADIEEGHISSALCHLANISYRLGETVPVEEAISRWMNCGVSDNAKQMLERSILQLAAADPHVSRTGMAMGVELVCDPASETLPGNEQASQMLTRSYRKPFVVPCAGNV